MEAGVPGIFAIQTVSTTNSMGQAPVLCPSFKPDQILKVYCCLVKACYMICLFCTILQKFHAWQLVFKGPVKENEILALK